MINYTCARCSDRGSYVIPVHCINCGQDDEVTFSKGHEASFRNGPRCENCGCSNMVRRNEEVNNGR